MQIAEKQILLLNLARKYIAKRNSLNIDVAQSSFCWLLNLPTSAGYFVLKKLKEKKNIDLSSFFFNIKQFINISTLHNYKMLNKINFEQNFNKLIISWASIDDFEIDGSYNDKYFNSNSKNNYKNLWFLIYTGKNIPQKLDKNIIIFGKENSKKKYNFFYLLKIFIKNILLYRGSPLKIYHSCSLWSHFAKIILKEIMEIVKKNKFIDVMLPYEAQPFQNTIFNEIRKENRQIKLIGYLHSTQPFPSFQIYRSGAPDTLLVHSECQIFHLNKYLNWPKSKLQLIPSLRYKKDDRINFSSKIVLPYALTFEKILLKQFDDFLSRAEKKEFFPLFIKNHPFKLESKQHEKFIINIKNIISKYEDRFSDKQGKKISIFFGGTSSILLALENGSTTIHICKDAVLESFTEALWPAIKVKQIDEYIFEYNLDSYGKCINFDSSYGGEFEKYCNL